MFSLYIMGQPTPEANCNMKLMHIKQVFKLGLRYLMSNIMIKYQLFSGFRKV
ncbi:hypothetical protein SAMN05216175_101285 [Neptunomonas qingdaonensis]|uniref:Uncharacterized protein n=1 Tax=Neptunomonas qingdaonensis TaxID=1045558 RepID=A0A1I2M2J2_9GAMM|nr:hypothetical protein SAMN05216175_101285 [Neptunomonas qingdaonensis]